MPETIEFTEEAVLQYLDESIEYWRAHEKQLADIYSHYYIDAFQSMRKSIFGETLPEPEELEHA